MVKLHFKLPHHLDKLHDELLEAGIKPIAVEGNREGDCWITISEDASNEVIKQIEDIVSNHDPAPPERVDKKQRLLNKIHDASNLDQLKEALIEYFTKH